MDETKPPGINIAQIFLLEARFEHGLDPLQFEPATRIQVQTKMEIAGGHTEDQNSGFVKVTVSTINDESAHYRFSLTMIGLLVRDPEAPNLAPSEFVAKNGAALMFPFLREALANLTGRGRFGPIWLRPVNFKAIELRPSGTEADDTTKSVGG